MDKNTIKEIALSCGFKTKLQPDGGMDLHSYVYEFADTLLRKACNDIGERDNLDMKVAHALDIIRSVRDDPISQPQVDTDTIHDPVNHPSHYTSHPSGVEAIEITRHMGFNLGNAMKYLWRNGLKDGQPAVQDLEKAVWYIQDEIARLKSDINKNSRLKVK